MHSLLGRQPPTHPKGKDAPRCLSDNFILPDPPCPCIENEGWPLGGISLKVCGARPISQALSQYANEDSLWQVRQGGDGTSAPHSGTERMSVWLLQQRRTAVDSVRRGKNRSRLLPSRASFRHVRMIGSGAQEIMWFVGIP